MKIWFKLGNIKLHICICGNLLGLRKENKIISSKRNMNIIEDANINMKIFHFLGIIKFINRIFGTIYLNIQKILIYCISKVVIKY